MARTNGHPQKRSQNMQKPVVLFLCTGNSARSQIAEAFLRRYAGDVFDAQSAGLDPKPVNPLTVEVMKEIGVDISSARSKDSAEFLGKVAVRYAVFVCSNAEERCPRLWPFTGRRLYWPFVDPAAATGTHEEKLAVFRDVRNQIDHQIIEWLKELRVEGDVPTVS
jgi:arsenate reductase